jgi:hypothetical protein
VARISVTGAAVAAALTGAASRSVSGVSAGVSSFTAGNRTPAEQVASVKMSANVPMARNTFFMGTLLRVVMYGGSAGVARRRAGVAVVAIQNG